jgi:hypothetical protein
MDAEAGLKVAQMTVIASEAKQSISLFCREMDCFVAVAPRNDAEMPSLLFATSAASVPPIRPVSVGDYPAATFAAGATFTASLP